VHAAEGARANQLPAAEAEARGLLGALAQLEGHLDVALEESSLALALVDGAVDPLQEARLAQQLGRVHLALGRRADAAAALGRSLDASRRCQWDEGVSAAQQLLAAAGA
jgi:tetratricopeptide (TPR) repeat protein